MAKPTQPPPTTVPTAPVAVQTSRTAQTDIAISVQVEADAVGTDLTVDTATSFDPQGALDNGNLFDTPGYSWAGSGSARKVSKVNGLARIRGTVRIRTTYRPTEKATDRSGYGRGTTPADIEAGNVTLGFHEACHRDNAIAYLKARKAPQFGGKAGMTAQQFDAAAAAFADAVKAYFAGVEADSEAQTDEVGYKRSVYIKNGPRPQP